MQKFSFTQFWVRMSLMLVGGIIAFNLILMIGWCLSWGGYLLWALLTHFLLMPFDNEDRIQRAGVGLVTLVIIVPAWTAFMIATAVSILRSLFYSERMRGFWSYFFHRV